MSTFEAEVETLAEDSECVRILIHEDESRTFISYEDDLDMCNPREDGWFQVCNLVVKHRDYVEMDGEDAGIEGARDRWGDEHPNVERYVRMFRPDIAHYEPRWTVQGNSQSDWSYGYGYVLWDTLARGGLTPEFMAQHGMTPASCFEAELRDYQRWFEGDVYRAVHISKGAEQHAIGDHGGYLTGEHDYHEDSCSGFLGYDDLKAIGQQFTSSPVIEEVYP